jgi:hypothetical protein
MQHVVQYEVGREFGSHTLIAAIKELRLPYTVVKITPFTHYVEYMDGMAIPGGRTPAMIWGFTCVDEVAKYFGWKPGVFKNDNFDIRVLNQKWGAHMLNADAEFYEFCKVPRYEGARFIRPVHDTKSFTGEVINDIDFADWQSRILGLSGEYTTLTAETPVAVSSVKNRLAEARFFVVDGKVVTGSTYRVYGSVLYRRVDSNNPVYIPMKEFAQQMIDIWQPVEAFVIDIAAVEDGYRVIEINSLNSSGAYDCDMGAVVRALEGWWEQQ